MGTPQKQEEFGQAGDSLRKGSGRKDPWDESTTKDFSRGGLPNPNEQ